MASKEPKRGKQTNSIYISDGQSLKELLTKLPTNFPLEEVRFKIFYGYYEEVDYCLEWEENEPEEKYKERLNKWKAKHEKTNKN